MKQKIFTIFIIFLAVFSASLVIAQTEAPEVVYPVAELGSCRDKAECFAYCELPENGTKCLSFARKYQLLSEEEIQVAEKVEGVRGGPGGCNSKASCENYCDDVGRIDECLAFAEENGLMKGKDLEEAKKVRAVIQSGGKLPGDCKNKTACEAYCENPEHMDECLAFAEAAGFLPREELEQAKKFLPLMKEGLTPGGCKSKDECEAYCEKDEHFEECMTFAEKHGMIPEEEREHIEAFKRAGGRGPGGCKGRQCQAFCEWPENQEVCFEWAKANGVLKEEDLRRMEEGRVHLEKVLSEAPPEVTQCLEEALGPGGLEKMRSGGFFGGETAGEKMKACFEGFMSQMGGEFGEGDRREDFTGPGGCKGSDQCMAYCKDNPEECKNFAPPQIREGTDREREGREFRGQPGENENFRRPEEPEFRPPAGEQYGEQFKEQHNQQYDRNYEEQSREQYQEQHQEQFQSQFQEQPSGLPTGQGPYAPTEGTTVYPQGGESYPSPDASFPRGESYPEPSGGTYTSPQSRIEVRDLLGLVLTSFLGLFR